MNCDRPIFDFAIAELASSDFAHRSLHAGVYVEGWTEILETDEHAFPHIPASAPLLSQGKCAKTISGVAGLRIVCPLATGGIEQH